MKRWTIGGFAILLTVTAAGCATNPPRSASSSQPQTAPSVSQATPAPQPPSEALSGQASSQVLTSGSFVSGEHETQGGVQIREENGQRYIELGGDFQTNSGPDLVVILHRSPDVIGTTTAPTHSISEGDYVIIAPLESVNGQQRYLIPSEVNVADYQSVGIWCRQFNATFGAASLQS